MNDYYPKVRNSDPATSWQAVDRMKPASTRMYARMIETLSASAASLAQPEIAERYKQRWDDPRKQETIRRRVTDLEQYGWIEHAGTRIIDGTRRNIFKPTRAGIRLLESYPRRDLR